MKLDTRIVEILVGVGSTLLGKVWGAIVDHGGDAAKHAEAIAKAARDAAIKAGLEEAKRKAAELGLTIAFDVLADAAQGVLDEWNAAEKRGRDAAEKAASDE